MSEDAGAGDGGQQGDGGGASGVPEWMATLSDETLRGDQTLSRYKTVDDMAKGLIESRRQASSRVVVPGPDADQAAMVAFYDQIGRPKEAKDYDIPVLTGHPTERADRFREFAHGIGLRPEQAKAIAEFENGDVAAELERVKTSSESELAEFKAATRDYDARLTATGEMLKKLGVDAEVVQQLDVKLGTKALMTFMFGLAEKFGEARRVDSASDPAGLGGGDLTNAREQLRTLDASDDWRAKIRNGDPEATAKRARLLAAANAQANKGA